MLKNYTKFFIHTLFILPALGIAGETTDVHTDTKLETAIRIKNIVDMHFGELEFTATDKGGLIHLNPLGIIYSGDTGYHSGGQPRAGLLDVTAARGEQISIICTHTATLTNAINEKLALQLLNAEYQIRGQLTYCEEGIKYIDARPIETITIGGKLNLLSGADATSGHFSSAYQGGTPLVFTITYE